MSDEIAADSGDHSVPVNPFFGGFVLETLTIGLYGETRNAIREYLQNGLDSVMQATDTKLIAPGDACINVYLEEDALVIRDNGIGLAKDRAVPTLTSIGASSKDYRHQAGFRGIGRLAGIAFCRRLVFITKAKGESLITTVGFDAQQLRRDMSPASGGNLSLERLLNKNVRASQRLTRKLDDHFFEVRLEGLVGAPSESTNFDQMVDFVSQVAPVAYADDFPFKTQIEEVVAARTFSRRSLQPGQRSALEEVQIWIHGKGRSVAVRKPYHRAFAVGRDDVVLNDIQIYDPPSSKWWGWIGHKRAPGAYREDIVKAIRVRVRNIQVDGTQIMGEMFSSIEDAASYGRFNDWYVGEIFVDPTFVIPNSRRDGFEEDENWETLRCELITLCIDLGRKAYDVSKDAQHSITVLAKEAKEIDDRTRALVAMPRPDTDRLISVSNDATKLQRKVSRAFKYADLEASSQLRSLENKLLDTKTRAVKKLGVTQSVDVARVKEQAQIEILRELMSAFRDQLDPATFSKVSEIVSSLAGTTDF
jgi:Histidine kinase-, DNA gyrase B-, and HSP90-like ATPase